MGLFNACKLCDARCCKELTITVTIFDVIRISKATGKKPEEFCEIIYPSLLFYDTRDLIGYYENDIYYEGLLALKSHPCIFLKKNLCSIYPVRPLACRLYPFNIAKKLKKSALCPPASKVVFYFQKPPQELIESYNREELMYRELVSKWNYINKKLKKGRKNAIKWLYNEGVKVLV